ncbi:TPA: zinc ribbon domain-containing protein [Legionella pneumophila]|nr:zinc ribbon domain-containing protein [Legionella pneumophila]
MNFLKQMLGNYLGGYHGGYRNSHHDQTSQHGNCSTNPKSGGLSCPHSKASLAAGATFCGQCGSSLCQSL